MDGAAENGFLPVVRWLHRNRNEGCSEKAMTRAAYNGHLPIVEWLHVHRSQECSVPAIEEAALCNNFEVVLFLHYQRHEKYTSKIAVQSYENGSQRSMSGLSSAIQNIGRQLKQNMVRTKVATTHLVTTNETQK